MNQQEIEARLKAIGDEQYHLREEADQLRNQLAAMKSPFAAGDRIEFRYGRSRIQGLVRKVESDYSSYQLKVQRYKKDGSLGAVVVVRPFDKPETVDP